MPKNELAYDDDSAKNGLESEPSMSNLRSRFVPSHLVEGRGGGGEERVGDQNINPTDRCI